MMRKSVREGNAPPAKVTRFPVILSKRSAPKDLRTVDGAKILRLRASHFAQNDINEGFFIPLSSIHVIARSEATWQSSRKTVRDLVKRSERVQITPRRQKIRHTVTQEDGAKPTSQRDAFFAPWIFPRPKEMSPGHFLALPKARPAFQIPRTKP